MEGEIMDQFPLALCGTSLQRPEPVVNSLFGQAFAALRRKDIGSIGIPTCLEVLIQWLARFVYQVDIAPLGTFVPDVYPSNFWTHMRMSHLQPGNVTDATAYPVAQCEQRSSTSIILLFN